MNREQAREIARKLAAGDNWVGAVDLVEKVADALHAAYEAERGTVQSDARLASIKETARRILAAEATTGEDSIRRRNGFNEGMDLICESTIDWAESFESAFERRYGGKP